MNANLFILVDETLYNNIVLKMCNKLNRNFCERFYRERKNLSEQFEVWVESLWQ